MTTLNPYEYQNQENTHASPIWIGTQMRNVRQGVAAANRQELEYIERAYQSWENLIAYGMAPSMICHLADITPADLIHIRYLATREKR
ncbi:hypothetical protein [Vibrio sp. 10N]|uniref:hypothetical protein n=1 Tax=Vibrio sp. 10N TaxID=3058938 RepID=UPI002812BBBF|nr:hypothetical protein VB10N_42080 [Vibrio sp. 10N]